jgi:hypothetical protein
VLRTVVGQRYERFSRELGSVEADPGDTPADSVGILDGDPVDGAAMTVGDLEALPLPGNAGIDAEGGTLLAESENPLQARAVEPARSVRVLPSVFPNAGAVAGEPAATVSFGSSRGARA